MSNRNPDTPAESVWDYPRPPRVEATNEAITIQFAGVEVARTSRALRVLETSHPPTYYLPKADVRVDLLTRNAASSVCEFKGRARYYDLSVDGKVSPSACWEYPEPGPGYEALVDHLCFYASRVDECRVAGEVVAAQEGDFYGGWITSGVRGPFKGGPGTRGW